ncbi:gamma-glutamyltransferase family protein [Alteribacillus sp. HJP-4]|uniref:gamma-glutamyltransferase family protein n=1 Tax=Alteribacillus sp. HJP-4 TaxID=2775394 RepID=UPI0035CCEB10
MFFTFETSVQNKVTFLLSRFPRTSGLTAAAMLSFLISGCSSEEVTEEPSPSSEGSNVEEKEEAEEVEESNDSFSYGVSAGHPAAVDAGMEILDQGGTAADAAVAAAYAVSVVEPFASGIGGGGVTLIHEQGKNPQAYDYREVVPENGIPSSDIGVPGFVAGMTELHADYGTAEWENLLDPAVNLAEEAEVSELLAEQLQSGEDRISGPQVDHLYPEGEPLEAGSDMTQEALAETLRDIRDNGSDTFYEGAISEELTSEIEGLDTASLSSFEVGRHAPSTGAFAGYEVIGAPPPLPGTGVIQMLQILEARGNLEEERDSNEFIHDTAMAWRIAQQFIETDYGDPHFVDVPVEQLTDVEENTTLAEEISSDSTLSSEGVSSYKNGDPNTTHITVVDSQGTVVSMTNTLTNFWGSGEYSNGFFLNNQMDRFSIGQEDTNEPEPGRRSVTWSSPMILADSEGPVLGIGSPGGERIPTMLSQVIVDWAVRETELEEAVEAPRFHLEDNTLIMEELPESSQQEELLEIGYSEIQEPSTSLYFGSIQALAINRETGDLSGATDPRREGDWQSGNSE